MRPKAIITEGMCWSDFDFTAEPAKQVVPLFGEAWQTVLLKNSQCHAVRQDGRFARGRHAAKCVSHHRTISLRLEWGRDDTRGTRSTQISHEVMIFNLIDDKDAAMPTGPFAVVRPKHLDNRRPPQLIMRYWTFENWLVEFHMRMLPHQF